jgi:4-diphosphocytidyl-2-C-methyl-D-erythritol kinase
MLIASYAKINLFLEVTGKLPNGYHKVNTVLCSIDLCDYISYDLCPRGDISFSCNVKELATPDNLICKIARYLKDRYHVSEGITIYLDKRIPIAAGLGGGSSNAATCITTLNQLWQLGLSNPEMHSIAAEFGSDINFFLQGGCALGENRGEQISPLPFIDIPKILLINPNIPIASSTAYKLIGSLDYDIMSFDPAKLKSSCFNRLEPGIRKAYPIIDKLLTDISSFGTEVAMMSGSGSTCFGIFDSEAKLKDCKAHFDDLGMITIISKTIS